jgi:hypothetical protein
MCLYQQGTDLRIPNFTYDSWTKMRGHFVKIYAYITNSYENTCNNKTLNRQ